MAHRKIKLKKILVFLLILSTLFLTGCAKNTDKEVYFSGWLFHNINDSVSNDLTIHNQDYFNYSFDYNFAGNSPDEYYSYMFFQSPDQKADSSDLIPVASPFNQKFYFYVNNSDPSIGDFSFQKTAVLYHLPEEISSKECSNLDVPEFSLESLNVDNKLHYKQASKDFTFGGPYTPASFSVSNSSYLLYLDEYLLTGKNTYFSLFTDFSFGCDGEDVPVTLEIPKYDFYVAGQKVDSGDLVNSDSEWSTSYFEEDLSAGKDYIVNLTIPSYLPVFNNTIVEARFSTNFSDHIPPRINNLNFPATFINGSSIGFGFEASDNVNLSLAQVYFSTNDGLSWSNISLIRNNSLFNGSFIAFGEKIDLKIVVIDSSNNMQSYTILPVSIAEKKLSASISADKDILSPGTYVNFNGYIMDDSNFADYLLVRGYYNGQEINRTYTHLDSRTRKNFAMSFMLPLDYSNNSNVSFVFGGAGIYKQDEYVIQGLPSMLETDGALIGLDYPTVLYAGENIFNVTVANVGTKPFLGNLSIYAESPNSNLTVSSILVNLSSQEVKTEPISIFLRGGYNNIYAILSVDSEDNSDNNQIYITHKKVISKSNVAVRLSSQNYGGNVDSDNNFSIRIINSGISDLNNISYSIDFAPYSYEETINYTTIFSGNLSSLKRQKYVEIPFNISFNETGEFIIRAIVNVSDDYTDEDNLDSIGYEIFPSGSNLRLYLEDGNYFANQSNTLELFLYNSGDKKTENGTVSFYYQEGYYDSSDPNLTLVEIKNVTLDADESTYENFSLNVKEDGYYSFVFFANASNAINGAYEYDNIFYMKKGGVDIGVDFDQVDDLIFVNSTMMVPILVGNYGNKVANNISLSLYQRNLETGEFTLINNSFINTLGVNSEKELIFSFVPDKKGRLLLYINSSVIGDTYDGNDNRFYYLYALNNGLDAAISSSIYSSNLVTNHSYNVGAYVDNVGNTNISSGEVSMYLDNILMATDSVEEEIMPGDSDFFSFHLIGNSLGDKNLSFYVNISGDKDTSDNMDSLPVYFGSLKNVSLSIFNLNPSKGINYILSRDRSYSVNDSSTLSIPLFDRDEELMAGSAMTILAPGINALQDFFISNASQNENITSDYISSLSQNGVDYYFVFNYKPSFSYNYSLFELFSSNNSNFDEAGINVSNLDDYVVLTCNKFNSITKQCENSWKEADEVNLDQYDSRIIFTGLSYQKIEAFALSSLPGFSGETNIFNAVNDKITNPIVEKKLYGKINFAGELNVSRFLENHSLLEDNIIISQGKIKINTDKLPEFKNVSARLTFKNINFDKQLVLYNGATCPTSVCKEVQYDSQNKTFYLNVTGFSEFDVVPSQDSSYVVANKTLHTSGFYTLCSPSWNCSWTTCQNNLTKNVCVDTNKCLMPTSKPQELIKPCVEQTTLDIGGVKITNQNVSPTTIAQDFSGIIFFLEVISLAIVIIGLFIVSIIIFRHIKTNQEKDKMMRDAKEFVLQCKEMGYDDKKIKNLFLDKGWPEEIIKKLIS